VTLARGEWPDLFCARRTTGRPVVPIHGGRCAGDGVSASYAVAPGRWLALSHRATARRLRADLVGRLGLARVACGATPPIDRFTPGVPRRRRRRRSGRLRRRAGGEAGTAMPGRHG